MLLQYAMPLYDPVYRKWLISAKNKDKDIGKTKVITVGIPTYLNCPDGSHK